jgi:hypothetical protein
VSEDRQNAPRPARRLRCWGCGRENGVTAAELRLYAVTGFPRCCGEDMRPAGRSAPPLPRYPDRLGRRWVARFGARAEVRRLGPPLGPDLGAGLVDVSTDGARVRLTAPAEIGEEVRVRLRRKGTRKSTDLMAEIRWCQPEGGGVYLAGLRLCRRLTPAELADLAR